MDERDNPDKSKTPSVDIENLKFLLIQRKFDLLEKIVAAVMYIICAYFAYLSIDALAGKTTLTNIVLSYLHSKESDYGLPWIVAIIASIWAVLERKERKRKIESLHKHNRELELLINQNRTTSGLLPTGDTNPRDDNL